jgi:flagellar hook-basal body complex protein FliE
VWGRAKDRSYLKKHSRALTILGALIVLFTFLVKEVFQEKVKELRDSLSEAERVELEAARNDDSVLADVTLKMRLGNLQKMII